MLEVPEATRRWLGVVAREKMSAVGDEGCGGRVWVWRYCLDCHEVSTELARDARRLYHCHCAVLECYCGIWCGRGEVEEVYAERGSSGEILRRK
jgi:hypothetical protein